MATITICFQYLQYGFKKLLHCILKSHGTNLEKLIHHREYSFTGNQYFQYFPNYKANWTSLT